MPLIVQKSRPESALAVTTIAPEDARHVPEATQFSGHLRGAYGRRMIIYAKGAVSNGTFGQPVSTCGKQMKGRERLFSRDVLQDFDLTAGIAGQIMRSAVLTQRRERAYS